MLCCDMCRVTWRTHNMATILPFGCSADEETFTSEEVYNLCKNYNPAMVVAITVLNALCRDASSHQRERQKVCM